MSPTEEKLDSEANSKDLLKELEDILLRDPFIDEVGFVHPSQFSVLNEELLGSELSSFEAEENISSERAQHIELVESLSHEKQNLAFWKRGHKLGISTDIILSLYEAAKYAFLSSVQEYNTASCVYTTRSQFECHDVQSALLAALRSLECVVMNHSKVILLLCSDFGTAWNSRKLILSKTENLDTSKLMDEVSLSSLILSNSPKSSHAWGHRLWAIKMISRRSSNLEDIVGKESIYVKTLAERWKMNYRAWNHCNQLVHYMTFAQVLREFKKSKDWACLFITDNCIFHYRRRLLLRMFEDYNHAALNDPLFSISAVWEEEFDWNEVLIKRYIGRETLWVHRRFLSQCWLKNFCTDCLMYDACNFINHEMELVRSCSHSIDNPFEDFRSQAMYSATYLLWLARGFHTNFDLTELKLQLDKACPEKTILWSALVDSIAATSLPPK